MTTSITAPGFIMTNSWLHRWIYYVVSGLMFVSVVLRSLLVFQNSALVDPLLWILAGWLLAFTGVILLPRQPGWPAVILISIEVILTQCLLLLTQADFFAFLFAIPCMQARQQFTQKSAVFLLALSTLLTFLTMLQFFGLYYALGTAIVYFGGSLFLITYIGSARRAREIQEQQQKLVGELLQANAQLVLYSRQMKQLAAGRERQRLARELHDSVTQTIFSMTLTTQSALMLLDRDRNQVASLLERLIHLNQNALSEMQVLISRLGPENLAGNGFIDALQNHFSERKRLNDLTVQMEVHGCRPLTAMEEQNLFRIVQEALNNVVKHSGVGQATVRLCLERQPRLEIEDQGVGFHPGQVSTGGKMGLAGMQERAREIGWTLSVEASPGNGTHLTVLKNPGE